MGNRPVESAVRETCRTRHDGSKPFIPAYTDNKTPQANRYMMLDFVDPVAGVSDADFESGAF